MVDARPLLALQDAEASPAVYERGPVSAQSGDGSRMRGNPRPGAKAGHGARAVGRGQAIHGGVPRELVSPGTLAIAWP